MRLRRLELQGFKSFVDRTILPFEDGITGVVGPNGCGKSNIVDAIQWVMGEQSAKHLRGNEMSDVIFNGSENRPATSMAEVSLVMDTEGMNLPPHLLHLVKGNELTITRRLFRDGSAEYLINKMAVRLRDVHEVFMDTGVGRRAYSIIEQGQIDRMINVKPEDRRAIFEEVAGITKYKTKRKEAERKLEQTRLNIERVDDIVKELEKQIRSLKIQATRARKFKEIKLELESIDTFLLGRKLFTLQENIFSLQEKRKALENEQTELEAKFSGMDARVTELDVHRLDQEKKIQENEIKERELALSLQRLENQLALFEQERLHLKNSLDGYAAEREEIENGLAEMEGMLSTLQTEAETTQESFSALTAEVQSVQSRLHEEKDKKRSLEGKQEELRQQVQKLSHREVYLENQQKHGALKESQLLAQSETLNQKLAEIVVAIEKQKEELKQFEERVEACRERGVRVEQEVASVHQECQEISASLTEVETQLFEAREAYHAKRSRLDSLKELQENFEGYSPTAREVLLKMGSEASAAVPLGELFEPEAEVEALLEALLGEEMNTLVVNTTQAARELTEKIDTANLERVSLLPLDACKPLAAGETPEGLVSLLTHVKTRPGFEPVAQWALGQVFLCSDGNQAFALRAQYPELSFVTRDGRFICDRTGIYTCGITPKGKGIFARKREIEELSVQEAALDQKVSQLNQSREELMARLESQETLHGELKDKLSSIHIENVELRKEKEKTQIEQDRSDRQYAQLTDESQRNSNDLEEIRKELAQWNEELTEVLAKKNQATEDVAAMESESFSLDAQIQELATTLSEKNIEKSKLEERSVALNEKLAKTTRDREQLTLKVSAVEEKRASAELKLSQIDDQEQEVVEQKDQKGVAVNALMVEISALKESHGQTCTELTDLRSEAHGVRARRDEIVKLAQDQELKLTQHQSDYEHQKNIAIERYEREAVPLDSSAKLKFEELPLFQAQVAEQWEALSVDEQVSLMSEHVENLRQKVSRYGEVNLTAITEFEEVQKRHDFLAEQKTDLENSIKILEQAITKIDETSKLRFSETFHGVNEKFQEVFPILFNGGKAELRLTNLENMLESGVDIMAQPPGKRLQSISLLSGGEKALTAVSLVLAIFARKPSPFCLLDEVDAPLDEANVSRFNTVIRRMAQKSQFIVVTHNRKTMDMADALFGVTMERAGVSKMTSVRLN